MKTTKSKSLTAVAIVALLLSGVSTSAAAGWGSKRTTTSSSRSAPVAPKPRVVYVPRPSYSTTTTQQPTNVYNGPGIGSTIVGGAVGAYIGNKLAQPTPTPVTQPQAQALAPLDCEGLKLPMDCNERRQEILHGNGE